MKIAVIGGVQSTDVLIRKLREHDFDCLYVWGYEPVDTRLVSGWADLGATSAELGIPYSPFRKVEQCEDELRDFTPDVVFAVGLSQLIPLSMLSIARMENVGFHPTALPRGRGRAAIAWLVLEGEPGAATFFGLREGVDDGPIFVQRPFPVFEEDDATSVLARVLTAEGEALDEWLPKLASGNVRAIPQEESAATWYGRRTPEDGWINWSIPAEDVVKLVRASTHPHPGALSAFQDVRINLWAAELDDAPVRGVIGRIVRADENGFVVQSGTSLVRATSWSADQLWTPKIGMRLGYSGEAEILRLRNRCSRLEERLTAAEEALQSLRRIL